jgi:hypothetical protein
MPDPERVANETTGGVARRVRPGTAWSLCGAAGVLGALVLDARTKFVPKLGEWYSADTRPTVILQVRAWLSGRIAPMPSPAAGGYDYVWGRGGMHVAWGLGLPIIGAPFHLVARLFGAPGFPDHVRFLILYAVTIALFARALQLASTRVSAFAASIAASALFLSFPTFVGLLGARFLIYDQTIAVGALWTVLLLAGLLSLLERATTRRLTAVCTAAAFVTFIRPPLAAYGFTTAVLAAALAHRRGLRLRGIVASVSAGLAVTALYFAANVARFGWPLEAGYANIDSGPFVNRLTRWGLEFAGVPFASAARELFATLFRLDPVSAPLIATTAAAVPAAIAPYAVGERWREYYSPTYDLWVLGAWLVAFGVVLSRVIRRRLWRRDRDLGREVTTIVGLWALPPSLALFVLYAKVGNLVTRYLVDMYPAFAAVMLCAAMAVVDVVRERGPKRVWAAQLGLAVLAVIYDSARPGWPHQINRPVDRAAVEARLEGIDARSREQPIPSDHVAATDPRGVDPVYHHFAEWKRDGTFQSGMVFAMPRHPCLEFTFAPRGAGWTASDEASLAGFRANADFDALVRCDAPKTDGATRTVTLCEPHPPRFLVDGMRLYAIASLDAELRPIDGLKLERVDGVDACP